MGPSFNVLVIRLTKGLAKDTTHGLKSSALFSTTQPTLLDRPARTHKCLRKRFVGFGRADLVAIRVH